MLNVFETEETTVDSRSIGMPIGVTSTLCGRTISVSIHKNIKDLGRICVRNIHESR